MSDGKTDFKSHGSVLQAAENFTGSGVAVGVGAGVGGAVREGGAGVGGVAVGLARTRKKETPRQSQRRLPIWI